MFRTPWVHHQEDDLYMQFLWYVFSCWNFNERLYKISKYNTGRFIIVSLFTNTRIYNKKTKRNYLNGIFHIHKKTEKVLLLTRMFDVCTTGDNTSIFFTAAMIRAFRPKGTDYCSSEEYRCTHVDACVARTWISYRCVVTRGAHIEHL
jgi:hypothetical protein